MSGAQLSAPKKGFGPGPNCPGHNLPRTPRVHIISGVGKYELSVVLSREEVRNVKSRIVGECETGLVFSLTSQIGAAAAFNTRVQAGTTWLEFMSGF